MSTIVHHKRRFFDYFPLPKFLEMPSIGLDISDKAIRFIELLPSSSGKERFHLKSFVEKIIPEGTIVGGVINKPEELKKILESVKKEHHYKFVSASLPEEKGYLFKTELPNIDQKYFAESIEFRLDENVPIDATKAVIDYNLIRSESKTKEAAVTVVPNKVVDLYTEIFKSAGLAPLSYELVTQSVARAVVKEGYSDTCMIIHIGELRAGFGVVSKGALQFTSTVNVGSAAASDEGSRLMLKDEIIKIKSFWQDRNENDLIKKIIISGRAAASAGLKEYLAGVSNCQVELANVWTNVFNFNEHIPQIPFEDSLDYAPAIGLALLNYNA